MIIIVHEKYESKINKHEQLKLFLYIEIFPSWVTIRIVYTVDLISNIDSRESFPQTTICYRNIVSFDQIFILRNDISSDKRTIEQNQCENLKIKQSNFECLCYHSRFVCNYARGNLKD